LKLGHASTAVIHVTQSPYLEHLEVSRKKCTFVLLSQVYDEVLR